MVLSGQFPYIQTGQGHVPSLLPHTMLWKVSLEQSDKKMRYEILRTEGKSLQMTCSPLEKVQGDLHAQKATEPWAHHHRADRSRARHPSYLYILAVRDKNQNFQVPTGVASKYDRFGNIDDQGYTRMAHGKLKFHEVKNKAKALGLIPTE